MSKKIRIGIGILVVIVLVLLFVPLKRRAVEDGGTIVYHAVAYDIVVWHCRDLEGNVGKKTCVYWFPNNYKSLDELREKEFGDSWFSEDGYRKVWRLAEQKHEIFASATDEEPTTIYDIVNEYNKNGIPVSEKTFTITFPDGEKKEKEGGREFSGRGSYDLEVKYSGGGCIVRAYKPKELYDDKDSGNVLRWERVYDFRNRSVKLFEFKNGKKTLTYEYGYDELGREIYEIAYIGGDTLTGESEKVLSETKYEDKPEGGWIATVSDYHGNTSRVDTFDAEGRIIFRDMKGGTRYRYEFAYSDDGKTKMMYVYKEGQLWRSERSTYDDAGNEIERVRETGGAKNVYTQTWVEFRIPLENCEFEDIEKELMERIKQGQ
ncbi:MAG: hypothetical protein J5532_06385 [Lachnospiraceae bacterium]|nr:hypothetical protein [Lachnospiraceae bacterium]